jgi:uracil-DNA glycosylase
LEVRIEESWKKLLQEDFDRDYFLHLRNFVKSEYRRTTVYPPAKNIFRAFDILPIHKVKVVILGQDPYHGDNQANGLCFSVNPGVDIPPSLKNIYKEIKQELGGIIPQSGDLTHWAEQGVLLLNATLTVEAHKAGSHQKKGWEEFTDSVVEKISQIREGLVFLLWGSYAQKKGEVIDRNKHLVLTSPHPSPLSASRGFFGNGHFKKTNDYLIQSGQSPINWFPSPQSI